MTTPPELDPSRLAPAFANYQPRVQSKRLKEGPHRRGAQYHAQMLFPGYTSGAKNLCIDRLKTQAVIFESAPETTRKKMLVRGLFLASFTLNATAIWTAKLLSRGTFSMRTQRRFFEKRWRNPAEEWGPSIKSCFARALSGFSIGKDGVCIDRHLQRVESDPKDAPEQWTTWFRTYAILYGPGEAKACIQWHTEVLDWIALKSPKPEPWK